MKRKILLISLFVSFLAQSSVFAQVPRKIIKLSYAYTHLSPDIVSILRKQIQDEKQYQEVVNTMQQHKGFYSLYIDTYTRESFFLLDSIKTHKLVSSSGHPKFTYTDSNGVMIGSEIFMESDVNYRNKIVDIEWVLSDEHKEINGHECQGATIKGHNDVKVWFTKDIPVNKGPAYFQGLFGLVLEASDFFGTINVIQLEYIDNSTIIEELTTKHVSKEIKTLSLKEVLALKRNFIRNALSSNN